MGKQESHTPSAFAAGDLMTDEQVAQAWGVSKKTITAMRHAGRLPYVRLGYRTVRFLRADVERFVLAHREGGSR